MINLRYHIVSITAVFLALGIGLAFGAAFIDRATVNQLDANLDAARRANDLLQDRNDQVEGTLEQLTAVEEALLASGLAQVVEGHLTGVPVVVVAARGVDEDHVERVRSAMAAAGAQVPGALWLTDRLALDDEGELADLRSALELPGGDAQSLRRTLERRLGQVLAGAAEPAAPPEEPEAPELPADDAAATTTTTAVAVEPVPVPPLVEALLAAGFLEFVPTDPPPAAFSVVPAADARYVFVGGLGADPAAERLLVDLVQRVAARAEPGGSGAVAVAAQAGLDAGQRPEDGDDVDAIRVSFVRNFRDDEALRDRVSTVDDLERFAGLVAAVLALDHGGAGQFGHYGLGTGAQAILPAAVPPPAGTGG